MSQDFYRYFSLFGLIFLRKFKIFIILLMILFSNKITYSEEKKFIYDHHKKILIEKKLLLNSFKKCEEYTNLTSVELFLNCSDKKKSNKKK